MNRKIVSIGLMAFCMSFSACNKSTGNPGTTDFSKLEQDLIDDFVNNTAIPQYNDLITAATDLNNNLTALNTPSTEPPLIMATRPKFKRCFCPANKTERAQVLSFPNSL